MNIYRQKKRWKFLLLIVAVIIGIGSLFYTNHLMEKLSEQERKRVELWAKAYQEIQRTQPNQDISFIFQVMVSNNTIPVMLVNENDSIISVKNMDSARIKNPEYLRKRLEEIKKAHEPIVIKLYDGKKNYIYYDDSTLLTQLYYYPFFQLGIISLFIIVSYFAFSTSRKSEQNHVWLGMSKETAHQLGTPISSLMGWIEVMRMQGEDEKLIKEMEKDVNRLQRVAERFSKIGSEPVLNNENLKKALEDSVSYINNRISSNVDISIEMDEKDKGLYIPLNKNLFEWVIENICKNAIDAMDGSGKIQISVFNNTGKIYIDIADTGKGMSKSKYKTVFQPGYTTRKRGWGLGLSLSKRIIEDYHKGKIFVKHSEVNQGTTIRIVLSK